MDGVVYDSPRGSFELNQTASAIRGRFDTPDFDLPTPRRSSSPTECIYCLYYPSTSEFDGGCRHFRYISGSVRGRSVAGIRGCGHDVKSQLCDVLDGVPTVVCTALRDGVPGSSERGYSADSRGHGGVEGGHSMAGVERMFFVWITVGNVSAV